MKNEPKISEDPKLNDVIFDISNPVELRDTRRNLSDAELGSSYDARIPSIVAYTFELSVPYAIQPTGKITLPRPDGFTGGIFYELDKIDEEKARDLARTFVEFKGTDLVKIIEATARLYRRHQPSLSGDYRLNAFSAYGIFYVLKPGDGPARAMQGNMR